MINLLRDSPDVASDNGLASQHGKKDNGWEGVRKSRAVNDDIGGGVDARKIKSRPQETECGRRRQLFTKSPNLSGVAFMPFNRPANHDESDILGYLENFFCGPNETFVPL